jgi:hypothetical protein
MKFRDILILEEKNDIISDCEKIVTYDLLNKAKEWWKNKLKNADDSFIKAVIKSRYGNVPINDEYTSRAQNDIDSAIMVIGAVNKLKYYANTGFKRFFTSSWSDTASMYYDTTRPNEIGVNCKLCFSQSTSWIFGALVHELQHAINPYIGTRNGSYLVKNIEHTLPSSSKSNSFTQTATSVKNMIYPSTKDIFSKDYILLNNRPEKRYDCSENENQSRINHVRAILNLEWGEKVTLDILRDNEGAYEAMRRSLVCWALRKDNIALEDFLNDLNSLATNSNKKPVGPSTYNKNTIA